MPITTYCTSFELETLWSEFGVMVRNDGDRDGVSDPHFKDAAIEEASARVNHFLLARYTVATMQQSTFVTWATAYIAANILGRRFGMSAPDGLVNEFNWYIEELKAIRDGKQPLMTDTGLATPKGDPTPSVTNFKIDQRFPHSKVRTIPSTSTDHPTDGATKKKTSVDHYWWD